MFLSRLCWTVALQTLASQADKAIFKIKNTIKTCDGIPITLALDLFEKILTDNVSDEGKRFGCSLERSLAVSGVRFSVICVVPSLRWVSTLDITCWPSVNRKYKLLFKLYHVILIYH